MAERKKTKHAFPKGFTIDKGHDKKLFDNSKELLRKRLEAFIKDADGFTMDEIKRGIGLAQVIKLWRKAAGDDEQINAILDKWEADIAAETVKNKKV